MSVRPETEAVRLPAYLDQGASVHPIGVPCRTLAGPEAASLAA